MPEVLPGDPQDKVTTPWSELLEKNASRGNVLYFFSSPSCTFCEQAYPWLEAIEKKYQAKGLSVVVVPTDTNQAIAAAAGVNAVPVLINSANGSPTARIVGWGEKSFAEVEVRLGLTDLFNEVAGLTKFVNPAVQYAGAGEGEGTCEGCGKQDNPALAELAENISKELDGIRAEIAELKTLISEAKK
jgi:thiol-disulfide isomerase/thioredoxin